MLLWCNTVTVFHKNTDPSGRVSWTRSVHYGCFWKSSVGRDPSEGAVGATATKLARIPGSPELDLGDIVILGEVTDMIDEYSAGSRSTDLKKRYRECFIVSNAHYNNQIGYPIPHTYAQGA